MSTAQITTFTALRFNGMRNRWQALGQMGRSPERLAAIDGLVFGKMLGSGGGKGFSIWPNFGVYCLLLVWEDETAARRFYSENTWFKELSSAASEHWTLFLQTVKAHGQWDGQSPFQATASIAESHPVAVLTRATIHRRHLLRFWTFVPPVSASVEQFRDQTAFSAGIGELPLIQQATFSLWRDSAAMKTYAYQSKLHSEVVRKTRELGWYSEELFARFRPYDSSGTWNGADPFKKILNENPDLTSILP